MPHLLRPLRGGAAAIIVVFAFGLSIASIAGLPGLPLALVMMSWYSKYAFILFDHIARGFESAPALDIQMVNPLDEQRPLAFVGILFLLWSLVHASSKYFGTSVAGVLSFLIILLLPACAAVLAMERNVIKALNPVALVIVVKELKLDYVAVFALLALYAAAARYLFSTGIWLPLQVGFALFAGLSVFSFLAGALYDRRHMLGLEVWRSPEHSLAKAEASRQKLDQRTIDEAYGLVRAGRQAQAWEILANWLQERRHHGESYEWLRERLTSWGNPRYLTRLDEEQIEYLLRAGKNGEALAIAERALIANPEFKAKTATATMRLAHVAADGGAPKIARQLVSRFEEHFPNDENAHSAQVLAQRLRV